MKKLILIVIILAVVGMGAALVLKPKPDTAGYRFVTVDKGTVESVVSATGTLRATSTVQVGTQVSGRIEATYVDFNDRVKAGQLIARIDPTLLEQEVRSAKAALERSHAELDQADRDLARIKGLYDQKAVTDSEFTTAQYQQAVAKANNDAAQINLDKAERNLKYTEIIAPVDGTVLERNVDVGQTVAASLQAPQLFLIAGDLSEMEILALVDESDIGRIEPDQEVRFTVQAYPDRKFTGKVRQVRLQSTTQENVVNYLVAVSVDNEDGKLLPGMTATVEFIVKRAEDVLRVANTALRFQPTEAMREEMQGRWKANRPGGADSTGGPGGQRPGGGNGAGNGNGRSWGGRPGGSRPSDRGLLWTVDRDGKLDVIPVKIGVSDGQVTEVSGQKLEEGTQVIAAVTTSLSEAPANPFDSRQGQRPGGPRPGF